MPEQAFALTLALSPLKSGERGQAPSPRDLVHGLGELDVELGQATGRMRRKRYVDSVPHVGPFRVMVHLLGHQCRPGHKAEGLAEVLELEGPLDGVATRGYGPSGQPRGQTPARRLVELLCHCLLL